MAARPLRNSALRTWSASASRTNSNVHGRRGAVDVSFSSYWRLDALGVALALVLAYWLRISSGLLPERAFEQFAVYLRVGLNITPIFLVIFFANGLAFDARGTLYVTESVSTTVIVSGKPAGPGSIWRIPRGGEAELWMRDEVLRGTGALGFPVWLGANGIAYYHGNLYVTNTEKGTVMRIPILKDGSAGIPDVWALLPVPESPIPLPPMGDGIALDVHGNLYFCVLTKSAVVRINAWDLSQETVAVFPGTPLDFPASLFFGTGKGERTSLFVIRLSPVSTIRFLCEDRTT